MERVLTLKKEGTGSKVSLRKLKIDMKQPYDKRLEKIANYFGKELTEEMLNGDISDFMDFNNFKWNFEIEKETDCDLYKRYAKDNKEHPVYNVYYNTDEGSVEIYTIPTLKIPSKAKNYNYRYPNLTDSVKILDIRYLYGLFKMLDMVYDFVTNNKFILSEEFKNISMFGETYNEEDLEYVLKFPYRTNFTCYRIRGRLFENYYKVVCLIMDAIFLMQTVEFNNELTDKYNKDSNKECARAFETKKNINKETLAIMNTTKFLNDFSYVEIDNDTDLSKFNLIEKEWDKVKNALNMKKRLSKVSPELRFKKLGKHRALGLYYPSLKCLCVDINSPKSFIHELGHYIDYTNEEGQLSLTFKFLPVINAYKKAFEKTLLESDNDSIVKYLRRKLDYYYTPTEIFARSLEIYLVNKGLKTSFLRIDSELLLEGGYPSITDNLLDIINEYFDDLIELDLSKMEEVKNKDEVNDIINKTSFIPLGSKANQIGFII